MIFPPLFSDSTHTSTVWGKSWRTSPI
jgi:hypothetical protein